MGGRGRGITGLCNLNRVNDGLAQLLQSPHGKRHLESSALSTAGLGEGGGQEFGALMVLQAIRLLLDNSAVLCSGIWNCTPCEL